MEDNGWIWACDRSIASEMAGGRQILDELLARLIAEGWSRRDRFAIHLAVEEALVNAIRHGNRLDPGKRVQISCRLSDELVKVEIVDEGPGFDACRIPDPTTDERLEMPGGRGLALMKAFMSQVEFSRCGRRVTLVKHRNRAECREPSAES